MTREMLNGQALAMLAMIGGVVVAMPAAAARDHKREARPEYVMPVQMPQASSPLAGGMLGERAVPAMQPLDAALVNWLTRLRKSELALTHDLAFSPDAALAPAFTGDDRGAVSFVTVAAGQASVSGGVDDFRVRLIRPDATFVMPRALEFSSPVPEPSTYALMLTGLLAIGAAVSRRRRR